jgi:hypothetical protein
MINSVKVILIAALLFTISENSYSCTTTGFIATLNCDISGLNPQSIAQQTKSCIANGATFVEGDITDFEGEIRVVVENSWGGLTGTTTFPIWHPCGKTWEELAETWYEAQRNQYNFEEAFLDQALGGLGEDTYSHSGHYNQQCPIYTQIQQRLTVVQTNVCAAGGCNSELVWYVDYVPRSNWGYCSGGA